MRNMNRKDLQDQIDSMSYEDRDDVYRYLWAKSVREDVEGHAADIGIELTPDDIDTIVERYVYDGDYDCNLDYWTNLENLMFEVTGGLY